jgi:hypothetical protein
MADAAFTSVGSWATSETDSSQATELLAELCSASYRARIGLGGRRFSAAAAHSTTTQTSEEEFAASVVE